MKKSFWLQKKILFLALVSFSLILSNKSYALENKDFKFCTHHNFTVTPLKINLYDIDLCNDEIQKLSYQNIWDKRFALVIKYNKDIAKKRLVGASIDEIKKYNQISAADQEKITKELAQIFPEVKKGDTISALYSKGQVTLEYNNKNIGAISDKIFAKQFISIWLNPKNEFTKMRFDLLEYTEVSRTSVYSIFFRDIGRDPRLCGKHISQANFGRVSNGFDI